MAEKKVRVLGARASVFCNRVEIALKLKGVDYEYFEENLQSKSPDLLKYNPVHKKIPVLVHGDNGIPESQVILEYIDEVWESGTPILPRDPYQRATARFWARFIDDKIVMGIHKTLWLGDEDGRPELLENLKILDKELQGKKLFGGDNINFVDIVANFLGYWLDIYEEVTGKVILNQEAFPSFYKWREEFLSCAIVQETLPPRESLAAKFRVHFEAARAKA